MSRLLAIDRLTFRTTEREVNFNFAAGLNTIIGPVGAGKSSLLEMIKYALGGDALLSNTVEENVRSVEVALRTHTRELTLSRDIGASRITAVEKGVSTTLTTGSSSKHQRAALYLLSAIDIPLVRVPQSRVRSTSKSRPITFLDVFAYCYASQAEIDTSVVQHTNPVLEPRRRATFELLLGLTDSVSAQLEVDRGHARDEVAEAKREAETVRRFLDSSGAPELPALRDEQGSLVRRIHEAETALSSLRTDLRAASPHEDVRRSQVAQLSEMVKGLNARLVEKRTAVGQRDQLVAQLELEIQRLERGSRAAAILDDIFYARCPRCLQTISERHVASGHCYLCDQPEQNASDETAQQDTEWEMSELIIAGERKRLEALALETAELRDEDARELAALENQIRGESLLLSQIEAEVEQRTREYVSPRFEAIAATSAELATANERIRGIADQIAWWERYAALADEIRKRESRLTEIENAIKDSQVRLSARREQLAELSATFAEELARFQPPWLDSARIDPQTYLPVVNEARFETQSAGEKTVINVAYHLALLVHALRHDEALVPTLLILDGPKSNLGTGPEDRALASRIYTRLVRLADAYPGRFQIIVADNDLPTINDAYPRPIELSYTDPLIPDVQHPGPSVETIYARR